MQSGFDMGQLLPIIVTILISLSVHESMHAFVGYKLGDTTAQEEGRISLNPLKHIDPFATVLLPLITLVTFGVPLLAAKPVPFNPARVKFDEFGAALIAAAGPLSNLFLALIGATLASIVQSNSVFFEWFWIFTGINVSLFVFNMIPIPPLDGSRVLYAFAPEALQRIMAQLEVFGIFIVFSLVVMVPAFSELLVYLNEVVFRFLLG